MSKFIVKNVEETQPYFRAFCMAKNIRSGGEVALDFLKMFESESVDGVLYDPPYSLRQVVECYKGFGKEVTQETTQASWRSRHLDKIARILKPCGKAICFGWNSAGVGKTRGFVLQRVLLVPHGGSKHDTIVTVETKEA